MSPLSGSEEALPSKTNAVSLGIVISGPALATGGLLVIDVYRGGTSGHAAHENIDNAIYNAIKAIEWFNTYKFTKISSSP